MLKVRGSSRRSVPSLSGADNRHVWLTDNRPGLAVHAGAVGQRVVYHLARSPRPFVDHSGLACPRARCIIGREPTRVDRQAGTGGVHRYPRL